MARRIIARTASRWRRDQDGTNNDVGSDTMSETAADAILSIEQLTLALPADADRAFAVETVSLALHPRQILCVVGESGSGKTVCASADGPVAQRHSTGRRGHSLRGARF